MLIGDGSMARFYLRDQLWSIIVTGLCEMRFVAHPEGCAFLAIPRISIRGRIDDLSRRQGLLNTPLTAVFQRCKLLLPNRP
jgi:hypothetical protein